MTIFIIVVTTGVPLNFILSKWRTHDFEYELTQLIFKWMMIKQLRTHVKFVNQTCTKLSRWGNGWRFRSRLNINEALEISVAVSSVSFRLVCFVYLHQLNSHLSCFTFNNNRHFACWRYVYCMFRIYCNPFNFPFLCPAI